MKIQLLILTLLVVFSITQVSADVILIGNNTQEANTVLSNLSIEDINACVDNTIVKFNAKDSNGENIRINKTTLKINDKPQDISVSYDIETKGYYYEIKKLDFGDNNITITVSKDSISLQKTKKINAINCFDAEQYFNEVTTRTRRFFEENQWSIAVGMIVLVSIVFLIVLAGKKSS